MKVRKHMSKLGRDGPPVPGRRPRQDRRRAALSHLPQGKKVLCLSPPSDGRRTWCLSSPAADRRQQQDGNRTGDMSASTRVEAEMREQGWTAECSQSSLHSSGLKSSGSWKLGRRSQSMPTLLRQRAVAISSTDWDMASNSARIQAATPALCRSAQSSLVLILSLAS